MTNVALGFRVKSGWAATAVVSGPASSPTVLHTRHVDLCDSTVPESRQPFHAVNDAQCELELDQDRINKRLEVVRHVTAQSIGKLLSDCRASGSAPHRAGIVAGSLVDPSIIRSPHIRAHALEGQLFRTVVEDELRAHDLSCVVLAEKTAFKVASGAIGAREDALKGTLATLGRLVEGPWRTEEKLAALAALVAVSGEQRVRRE